MLFRHWKVLLVILAVWGSIFSFSLAHIPNTVTMDQWQMVSSVLGPYFAGDFSFLDLVSSHNSHIKIGYRGLFLLNAILFDLNTRYELMAGFMLLLVFVSILFRAYLRSNPDKNSVDRHALFFLAILPIALSLNRISTYIHPLVSMTTYTTWVIMLLFWTRTEKALREGWGAKSVVHLSALMIFLIFGVTGGGAPSIILTSFCLIALSAFLSAEGRLKKIKLLLTLLAVSATLQLIYWKLAKAYAGHSYAGNLFHKVFENPAGAAEYVFSLLANSALNDRFLRQGLEDGSVIGIGIIILLLYSIAITLYFRTKMYQRTYLPFALILFPAFVVGALLSARFGRNWGFALRTTFANSPQLGLIGVFWIFVFSIQHYWESIRRSKVVACMAVMPFLLLLIVEYTNIQEAIVQLPKEGAILQRSVRNVSHPKIPRWASAYCSQVVVCGESLELLRRERLNIFAKEEDRGKARRRSRSKKKTGGNEPGARRT